jgi:paraquat-inducible protein A
MHDAQESMTAEGTAALAAPVALAAPASAVAGGPSPASTPMAAAHGLALCHACGLLSRLSAGARRAQALHPLQGGHSHCPRCAAPLHLRKPFSISRTWALVIAAFILYLPANVLPFLETTALFETQSNTIASGR